MKYLWTEDTGAELHFWKLVNQLFFDDALVVESKESNQGLLDALTEIDIKEDDKYYISFDYVVDNQDIRNKYRMLKSIADKAEGKIIILDMICFEYLILAFDKLVAWTGTGKIDKIKIREEVLSAIENHRINLSKIDDEKTLQYLAGFKRYSTERVMKSLMGEFTQNEKWSVKGALVHSFESLQATDSPTPEPPSDNPLLEAAGITCEVPQTQSNGSDVTARPQFGPSLVPPNTASRKIIQMSQRKII